MSQTKFSISSLNQLQLLVVQGGISGKSTKNRAYFKDQEVVGSNSILVEKSFFGLVLLKSTTG